MADSRLPERDEVGGERRTDARPSRVGRRSTWRGLALKIAVAGIATLVLLELALRVVGFKPATAEVQPRDLSLLHPEPFVAEAQRNGWIPWPKERRRIEPVPEHPRGFIEIRRNDCSCREDEDTPLVAPPNVQRIVVLGDSHTDGICFNDESFANLLERRLNQASRSDVDTSNQNATDVVNAGFALSSTYQQYWAYEKVYRHLGPRRVVLVFYAGNDLLELLRRDDRVHLEPDAATQKQTSSEPASAPANTPPIKSSNTRSDESVDDSSREPASAPVFVHVEARGGGDDTRTSKSTWSRVRGVLRDHSATYHALTRINLLRRFVRSADADQYRERLDAAFQAHSAPVWQGLNQAYYFQHHPDDWETAWALQRRSLELLRDRCRASQCELTFVVLPTMRQIHPQTDAGAFERTIALLQLDEAALLRDDEACARAVAVARELDVLCLDLRSALQRARRTEPDEPLYYQFDHHLNLAGHRVVAAELETFLANRDVASQDMSNSGD